MLNRLPPRERQIVDLLYASGSLTVRGVQSSLPDRLSDSAVRAMLQRLVEKGYLIRSASEQGTIYSPLIERNKASATVLKDLVRVFFEGSPTRAATALLGMSETLTSSELNELEDLVVKARAKERDGR